MPSSSRTQVELPNFQHNDPEQLFVCPYDPVHRVRAMKLPYHLQKCRRQYPCSDFATCPFNARHTIPAPELEIHIETCEDRHSIAQEFAYAGNANGHGYVTGNLAAPKVDNFDTGKNECWDEEIDESVGARGINFGQIDADAFSELRELHEAQLQQSSVFAKPQQVDVSGMSASAKKNYKRALKRREQAAAKAVEEQDEEDEYEEEYDDISPEERRKMEEERKLQAIRQQYPLLNGKQSGSFVDYKSILNIYCQKHRINPPAFREASGVGGGFGAECIVRTDIFRSKIHAKKKKDAYQDSAKQALLGLNIDVGPDPTPCRPSHMRTAEEKRKIREMDELKRAGPTLHQPRIQQSPRPPAMPQDVLTNQMSNMSVHETMSFAGRGRGRVTAQSPGLNTQAAQAQAREKVGAATEEEERNPDDEWTVVTGKKTSKPVFQLSLNMAGRGRGRK